MSILRKPAGRRSNAEAQELSDWFNQLSEADQTRVQGSIDSAVRQTLYNLLLVFDGVLPIESGEDKGQIELWHEFGGIRTRLNELDDESLGEVFKNIDVD
jgi:hypothetical protein